MTSVRLFGSRKYLGKVRSDLDLLISGPSNLGSLSAFRSSFQHYQPLDLWLATGETATSVVNGSTLPLPALRFYELFPESSGLPPDLRVQQFRADIEYKMTLIPPASYVPIRGDHLGLGARLPTLLSAELIQASEAIVSIIENGLEVIRRMRRDGNARRGEGTKLVLFNEYDFQNLTELVLSPVVSLQREPFVVECQGIRRRADFSLANGRLILELKMSKNSGELASAIKDARGVLECYLDHPGVEVALAILAVASNANADKNAIESWAAVRGARRAIMRVVVVPEVVLTSD